MNETHFEGKIAQKAIVLDKHDRVLLVRDPRESEEIWELPGGRLNVDEGAREGLVRELKEELGVVFNIHEVIHMEQFIQGSEGNRAFVVVYRGTLEDTEASFVLEDTEVSEVRWVSRSELQNVPLFPEYSRALESFFSKNTDI